MAQHCSPLFGKTAGDERAERVLAAQAQTFPGNHNWFPDEETIEQILKRKMMSSPGPDGITYQCYSSCVDLVLPIYKEFVESLINGVSVIEEFNDARVAVIDKLAAKKYSARTKKANRWKVFNHI